MQEDDLISKLSGFGFTVNQAKVYLSIVTSGATSVSKIALNTRLHRQDIYKIIPKLERMGLIMKTIDKPSLIAAIPIEKGLSQLVLSEKEKTKKRITHLEANLKELTNVIREQQSIEQKPEEDENWFIPLTTAEQITNRSNITFGNVSKECNLVINLKLIKPLMNRLQQHFQRLEKNKVKIRIIIENSTNDKMLNTILKTTIPKLADIAVKLIIKKEPVPYYVIDHKEVWISMKKETEAGLPCVLWTKGSHMVQFFDESFNETWNNPNAINIYPEKQARKELVVIEKRANSIVL